MSLRRATWLVSRREFLERIRTRAFQISLVLTVVLVAAVGIVAGVVGDDGPEEYTVGAVGPEAQVVAAAAHVAGRAVDVRIEVEDQPNAAAARAGVRDESLDAALVGNAIVSLEEPPAELAQLLQESSRLVRTEQALQREGLSGDERIRALQQPPLPTVALEGEDDGSEGVAFVASLVLYLQLIMYGIAVASGVVEEKSSRVIEVLLATVQPRAILAGKILGIGALGLLQLTLTAVVGLAAAAASGAIELERGDVGTLAVVLRVVPVRLPRLVVALRDGGRDGVAPRGSPVLDHGAHAPARDRLPARIPGDRRSGRRARGRSVALPALRADRHAAASGAGRRECGRDRRVARAARRVDRRARAARSAALRALRAAHGQADEAARGLARRAGLN